MVRLAVRMTGAQEALELLDTIDSRMNREPLTPLLRLVAEDWASTLQQNILDGKVPLPEAMPATIAIRRHYGHEGKARLVRGGELLHSIAPLEVTDDGFVVGTDMAYASVLFTGGEVTEKSGRTHQVQAHPFLLGTDEMVDDALAMVSDWFTGGGGQRGV